MLSFLKKLQSGSIIMYLQHHFHNQAHSLHYCTGGQAVDISHN